MRPESAVSVPHESRPGHDTILERPAALSVPIPLDELAGPSYYDIPLLKKPVWSKEIGIYFFLGGLSAGSYILARVAEWLGGERYRSVTRAGTAIAAAAVAPCPVLLIVDLGDPSRFHHMLRVFKPRSPMNLGSWVLTGYSGVLFLTALREWFRDPDADPADESLLSRAVGVALDAAGLPLALLFSGYTGVLLSATSTPVWSRNPWLGPLFTASAISNSASAISLALELRPEAEEEAEEESVSEAVELIDTAAHVAEGVALAGYLATAGDLAKPLTQGKLAPYFWGAAAGLVVSEVLKHVPTREGTGRWTKLLAGAIGVASGFALKWAMQQAGPPSASDPEADRQVSRPRRSQHLANNQRVK